MEKTREFPVELIDPAAKPEYNSRTHMLEFGDDHPYTEIVNGKIVMKSGDKVIAYDLIEVGNEIREHFKRGYIGINREFLKSIDEEDAITRADYILESLRKEINMVKGWPAPRPSEKQLEQERKDEKWKKKLLKERWTEGWLIPPPSP